MSYKINRCQGRKSGFSNKNLSLLIRKWLNLHSQGGTSALHQENLLSVSTLKQFWYNQWVELCLPWF
jgi:hypothetical protein